MEMAVEHQQELARRGKEVAKKMTNGKPSPWGVRAETAPGETPFRKRKVGSTDAVPVEATMEAEVKPDSEGVETGGADAEQPAKRRGPRRSPTRKGGKRPSVAARKAAQKAEKAGAKNGKGKKKSGKRPSSRGKKK